MIGKSSGGKMIGINPVPQVDEHPFIKTFLDGASPNQNVLGTLIAPVDFIIAPPTGERWYVTSAKVWLEDKGSFLMETFGAIAELTNGWLVEADKSGSTLELFNMKTNAEVFSMFASDSFINNKDLTIETIYGGTYLPEKDNLILDGDLSDVLRFRVRDDLTGVTNLSVTAMVWKEL